MKLTFLGTGCMVPSKERNVQGLFLKYKNKGILFDCGEGTQRQMNFAGIKRTDTNIILISHWHGDHIGGLLPLLMTLSNVETPKKIKLFGPKDSKNKLEHLFKSSFFDGQIDIDVTEINAEHPKTVLNTDEFKINAANMDHQVPCVAYSFVEKDKWNINMKQAEKTGLKQGPDIGNLLKNQKIKKNNKIIYLKDLAKLKKGKKITIILDTLFTENALKLAEESDVLIVEATYLSDLTDKAKKHRHLTTKDAALIASQSNTKQLYLTHFSQRYKNVNELEKDAKIYFKNVTCAKDFMQIKL